MHTKRLFIGIPLSGESQKRLARERKNWEDLPLFLIPAENLHVTLLFLGFVEETEIASICDQIEEALQGIESFEVLFTEIDIAPNKENPTMIWLKGEVSEELRQVRARLEATLGYRVPERRSFRPHVNVARLKRAAYHTLDPQPVIQKKLSLIEPVSEIVLYESSSENGKRRYQPLFSCPLD